MGFLDNKKRVSAKLAEGKTRQEIFADFSDKSPGQSGKIAFSIASIPTEKLRRKYLLFNHLLFSLLIGYSALVLSSAFPLPNSPSLALFLKIFIPLIFAFYVYNFHGGIYRLLLIWSVIDLIEVVLKEISYSKAFVLGFILLLSLFLSFKVFPHFGLIGPKRNAKGSYRLE